jgi:hypothetical protein
MVVDFLSYFAGEMRCPVGHPLTRKRGRILDAEKRRQHGSDENGNGSFHLHSLLYIG